MLHNLKTLGLALPVVLAISAAAASAAFAVNDTFTFEASPTTLTGSQEANFNNKFKILGQNVECETATFEATVTGTFRTEVTGVVPTYGGCTFAGQEMTVDMGTCTYTLAGATDAAGDGQVKIANCGATPVTLTLPTLNCRITISNQTAQEGVKYTNIGTSSTSELTIDLTIKTTLTVEHVGPPTAICNELTPVTTGRQTGQVLVTGENPTTGAHQGGSVS